MSLMLAERPATTTEEIVSYLIKYNGKLNVVAEKLHITEEALLILLADKNITDTITEQIRIRVLLKTYEQFGLVSDMMQAKILEAEPADVLRLHTSIVKNITEMVGKQENTLESILKALPPNVRESVVRLMAG